MTRQPTVAATAAALTLLATACASTGQTEPADLTGCYYFQQDPATQSLQLPWGIRLLETPLEGWPALAAYQDVRLATTLTGRSELDHPFGYWRPLAADSLLVGYPAGGGLELRAAPGDPGLTGVVRALGDASLDPPRSYTVRLLRARCPEES